MHNLSTHLLTFVIRNFATHILGSGEYQQEKNIACNNPNVFYTKFKFYLINNIK